MTDEYAIIELKGHARFGARVRAGERFGLRGAIAETLTDPPVTQIIPPSSVHRITLCSEEEARRAGPGKTIPPEVRPETAAPLSFSRFMDYVERKLCSDPVDTRAPIAILNEIRGRATIAEYRADDVEEATRSAIAIAALAFILTHRMTIAAPPPAEPAAPEIRRHPKNPSQVIEPAPPPGTLAVWHNGWDWVVASSREDARDVACASSGERREDYDAADWERCADGSTVTIRDDNGVAMAVRSCAEWVVQHGRGFLCSTES